MMHYAALVDNNASELSAAIGVKVRSERQAREWTLDQLANLPLWADDEEKIPLASVANLEITPGMRQIQRDDRTIDIRVRTAPDTTLVLDRTATAIIGIGFLLGLPVLLLLSGITIWLRRRRR